MKSIGLALNWFQGLKKRHKTMLLCLAGAVLFSLYFNNFYKPSFLRIHRLRSELISVNSQITKAKKDMPNIYELRASLSDTKKRSEALSKEVRLIESELPTQSGIPRLLGRLVDQAQGLNIEFISVKPKQSKQKGYAYLEIELKISSDYPNLTNYLNRLESFSKFLSITQVSIEQLKKEPDFEANTTIILSVLLGEPSQEETARAKQVEAPVNKSEDVYLNRNPLSSDLKPSKGGDKGKEYILNGITSRGKDSTAIINNEVYKLGDTIGNKKVKQIMPNMVILSDGKQDTILLMEM